MNDHVKITRIWEMPKLKTETARITKPGGVVLSFGCNTGGIGKTLVFFQLEILIVCHGAMHNDTLCVAERKGKPDE